MPPISRKNDVREHNWTILRDSRRLVTMISALREGHQARQKDVGNLQATLLLSIRIMLIYRELWTERGLANDAFGTINDIIWRLSMVFVRPSSALYIRHLRLWKQWSRITAIAPVQFGYLVWEMRDASWVGSYLHKGEMWAPQHLQWPCEIDWSLSGRGLLVFAIESKRDARVLL